MSGNQLFGRVAGPGAPLPPPALPAGISPVEGTGAGLELWAADGTTLRAHRDPRTGATVHLWGMPAHPTVARDAVAAWVGGAVTGGAGGRLAELTGTFVAVVHEPAAGRVSLVNDVLGIRPLLLHEAGGAVAFGSDAWALHALGFAGRGVDMAAVGAWVVFGFNGTDAALFAGLRRAAPGSVATIENGAIRSSPYVTFAAADAPGDVERLAAEIHDRVDHAVCAALRGADTVALPLSGGFDSRHLLANARAVLPADRIRCVHVGYDPHEAAIARAVAAVAGTPLDVVDAAGSPWDLYDDPFGWTADGFPITRFGTDVAARRDPGRPSLNGFMGDSLVAGSKDRIDGRTEPEWGDDAAAALIRFHRIVRTDVFGPAAARALDGHARAFADRAVAAGRALGKVFAWADFYQRQRFYIANNFLLHLDAAEALTPFYQAPMLALKLGHAYGPFAPALHARLLQRFFPAYGAIPHAAAAGKAKAARGRVSRFARRTAPGLAAALLQPGRLRFADRAHCLPRVLAAAAGHAGSEDVVMTLERLRRLEDRLAAAGLAIDWRSL
ncbi:MAG: asparagine synthase-related protein [Rhodospirillaceae bacterium]